MQIFSMFFLSLFAGMDEKRTDVSILFESKKSKKQKKVLETSIFPKYGTLNGGALFKLIECVR